MAQNTARSHAIGQINVAHRLGLHNSAVWMLQTNLSEMWANCNSDAPHKQGHSAQNVTRYTIWNGVLSIIQSAMVPILICITITGYAELSQSCLPRISLPERFAPIKKFQLQSSVGEVVSRENNLQGVFWGDHSPRRDWVYALAHNVNTSIILKVLEPSNMSPFPKLLGVIFAALPFDLCSDLWCAEAALKSLRAPLRPRACGYEWNGDRKHADVQ